MYETERGGRGNAEADITIWHIHQGQNRPHLEGS